MPGLISQIEQAVGGLDFARLAGGTGAQYGGLASSIGKLGQGAPGDFGSALAGLSGLRLPDLALAGSLGQGLSGLLPSLSGGVGGLVSGLTGDVSALPERLQGELLGAVKPLLDRIETLRIFLASDWSCGLVPGFAPAPGPAPGPAPAPAPGPAPAPAPAPASTGALSPAQVSAAKATLDKLPADLTVPGLLHWLHERVGTFRPGYFTVSSLPFLDDIRDPLDTLVRWEAASATAVRTELGQTLSTLTGIVQAHSNGRIAAALPASQVNALPAAGLGAAAETFIAALETLATQIQAPANPVALQAAFASAQAARAGLLAQNAALAAAAGEQGALTAGLAALPAELDASLCRLLMLLQPRATLADVADAIGPFEVPALPANAFAPLTSTIDQLRTQLEALLDAVDLSAATQPLTDALAAADSAVNSVEQGLALLSAQVVQSIGQARTAVAGLDLGAVRDEAIAAIEGATAQISASVGAALAPASQALGDAIDEVSTLIDGIDPEALAQPLREAIDALGTVLQDQAVQRLREIIEQLEELAQTITTLSFEPVADQVIALIGELKSLLAGIDISSLPDPGPGLIAEALKLLPQSLVPLTDPLVAELDAQIAGSPLALLEQVKTLPDQAREKLLAFSPRAALQPLLSDPFRRAVSQLDDFAPTQWLAAGDGALAELRKRLAAQLDIGRLLAEPARAHGAVLAELERLRPSTLLAPVEQAVEAAVAQIATALPVGDLATALQGALGRITGFTATVNAALDVARHLTAKLAALGNAEAEFEAWLATVLAKVPDNATGVLATALVDLRAAALAARPARLAIDWDAARAPLSAALDQAGAAQRLTRLALARGRVQAGLASPAVASALPGLAAWLAEAGTRSAGEGLQALSALERALAAAQTALAQQFSDLASAFPAADGPYAPLLPSGPATLRDWLHEAVRRQLGVALLGLLQSLAPMAALVNAAVAALQALVDALDAKLADLLAAPQALADLLASVAAVQQRLARLDLGIYTREVDTVFLQLTDELRVLDPRSLQAPLEAARDRLLAQLSLTALLPPALRGQLDAAYRELVAKLGSLDPDKLLLEPLDAEYRETVEPLARALDISDTVQLIIDWLQGLPADLRTQIARIDGPYGELLRSAPGGGGSGGGSGAGLAL